ncbi:MAG TPA: CcmD family protein [Terriglobales bacterium]|nr:CcmD family protein [Terriglobales bacterium]
MNSVRYLYAAYIATWAIHGAYLAILVRKYSRIRREMESLKKKALRG